MAWWHLWFRQSWGLRSDSVPAEHSVSSLQLTLATVSWLSQQKLLRVKIFTPLDSVWPLSSLCDSLTSFILFQNAKVVVYWVRGVAGFVALRRTREHFGGACVSWLMVDLLFFWMPYASWNSLLARLTTASWSGGCCWNLMMRLVIKVLLFFFLCLLSFVFVLRHVFDPELSDKMFSLSYGLCCWNGKNSKDITLQLTYLLMN